MKIAVVLRGQARCAKVASKLFYRHVVDQYPQHDFDVYVHTTNTETIVDTLKNKEHRPLHLYDLEITDLDYIEKNYLNHWKPKKFIVEGTSIFFKTIEKIINLNNKDVYFQQWLEEKYPHLIDTHTPNLIYGDKKENYRLRLHSLYFMAQHWGAARVYNLLQSSKQDYDLVIQTRPDCFFYFEEESLQNLKNKKQEKTNNSRKNIKHYVMSNILGVRHSRPFVSDTLYISDMATTKAWFPDTEQTFVNLFTKHKNLLVDMLDDREVKWHNSLFVKLGKDLEFIHTENLHHFGIVRPDVSITENKSKIETMKKIHISNGKWRDNRTVDDYQDYESLYYKLLNNDLWLEGSYE